MVADQAERAVTVEQPAIEGDHPGRLLTAMLQGVQPEHGMRRRLVVAVDAEHAALFAQLVGIEHAMPGHDLTGIRAMWISALSA